MREKFEAHVRESGLLSNADRVLVGYSGGADSTCLVHLLATSGYPVVAAHLHHLQRSEADADEGACRAFAESLGVEFVSGKADVPLLARQRRLGLEEAGRAARYAFFEQAVRASSCSKIATAHTFDDQAETILMRAARGTGLQGLGGIPEAHGQIVRPLLGFRRSETQAYCERHGLPTRSDASNTDLRFARARIRLHVLPELEAAFPGAKANLVRLGQLAREESAALDAMAAAALEQAEFSPNGQLSFLTQGLELVLDSRFLAPMLPALLRRALRLACRFIGGEIGFDASETAARSIRELGSGSVTAEGGTIALEWSPERVHVRRLEIDRPLDWPCDLGELVSEVFGWRFELRRGSTTDFRRGRNGLEAVFDPHCVRGRLVVRTLRMGEKLRPLGAPGRRLVSDLLGEMGLTQAARARLVALCDDEGPIWIPGVCLAERGKITPVSRAALVATFGPI